MTGFEDSKAIVNLINASIDLDFDQRTIEMIAEVTFCESKDDQRSCFSIGKAIHCIAWFRQKSP
jgi:hypothetical protein